MSPHFSSSFSFLRPITIVVVQLLNLLVPATQCLYSTITQCLVRSGAPAIRYGSGARLCRCRERALLASVAMAQNGPSGDIDVGISDVDYRVIGLSPQYWAYTPLLIGDLVGLPLINGVDCFVAPSVSTASTNDNEDLCDTDVGCEDQNHEVHIAEDNEDEEPQTKRPKGSDDTSWNILPLSRVLLRGIATAIDKRPNGCTLIVLDDGTGSIDCRHWDESQSGNVAFNLPALLPDHEAASALRNFAVGDSLEVMGKIKALTAGHISDRYKHLSNGHSGPPFEVRFGCVREVHATSVCLIGKGETRDANQWNGEIVHWLKCMEFSRKCNSMNVTNCIRNGKGVLPLLGKTIASSILGNKSISDFSNLDQAGSSNILNRKCCQTPYRFRSAFFYCHCEATLEALDPNLQYRDALLNRLLDMEGQLQRCTDSLYTSATEDCMDLYGAPSDSTLPPLLFNFESLYKDKELTAVASEIVASTNLPEANAQRLVRKTFAGLTNDGILSLFDPKDDLYLLITRTRVIEPFLKRCNGIPQPFFIRSVPKKRIGAIMNCIECDNAG